MFRIGRYILARDNELRDLVTKAMPETIAARGAALVDAELLRACMEADAYLHARFEQLDPAGQQICQDLVDAIGPALAAHNRQEA